MSRNADNELLERLCTYDVRNPDHATFTDPLGDGDPAPRAPGEDRDCSCDNCFYGRHALAVELLAARATIARVIEVVDHYQGLTGVGYQNIAGTVRNAIDNKPTYIPRK